MRRSIHTRPRDQLEPDELEQLRAYRRAQTKKYRLRHEAVYQPRAVHFGDVECASTRPTAEMLEDAHRRANEPRTVGQRIFGDPPLSQSALAQRPTQEGV